MRKGKGRRGRKAEGEEVTATSRTKKPYKEDFRDILRPRIAVWVKAKAYTHEQFTLEELASRLYTNKTYLSTFIKDEYDMNFSGWVTNLRIDEAKRIMMKEPEKRLQEVAFECGFSSLTYFPAYFPNQKESLLLSGKENSLENRWRTMINQGKLAIEYTT